MPSQGEFELIRSVYFASSETTSNGMYTFKPELAERPNADNIFKTSILFFYQFN